MPESAEDEQPHVKVTPAAYTAIITRQGQLQAELGTKVTIPDAMDVILGIRKKTELKKEE